MSACVCCVVCDCGTVFSLLFVVCFGLPAWCCYCFEYHRLCNVGVLISFWSCVCVALCCCGVCCCWCVIGVVFVVPWFAVAWCYVGVFGGIVVGSVLLCVLSFWFVCL